MVRLSSGLSRLSLVCMKGIFLIESDDIHSIANVPVDDHFFNFM